VSGSARFTFDIPLLYQGLEFITIAVGMFALGEVFTTIFRGDIVAQEFAKIGRIMPTRQDLRDSIMPILRGSVMGFFLGVLPGAGPTLSSFISYTTEKRLSKTPERFGKGAIEGLAGPESANNAAAGDDPLFLGIPSSATTAILMGAFIMYNAAGPLFPKHPAWSGRDRQHVFGNVVSGPEHAAGEIFAS
jgi:putative tricarboxylic transport membrane protein